MKIPEQVRDKLRDLPPDKQKAVLEFVNSLEGNGATPEPLKSLEGLWSEYAIEITAEDIAEARKEMWGNFPASFPAR
jgi:EAL domain-containing protein (putative c-di-GMP-specific phosphodiesterase class I)